MAIDRESIVDQAKRMQDAGLHEVAAGLYKKITDDAPDDVANAPVYVIIGDLLLLADKREEAAAAYTKADQLKPSPEVRDKLQEITIDTAPVPEPVVEKKKKINLPIIPEVKLPNVHLPVDMPDVTESYNKFHFFVNTPQHAKIVVRITFVMVALALILILWEPWNWFFKKGAPIQFDPPHRITAPKGVTPGGK